MHTAYLIRMHMAEDHVPSIGIVCEPLIGSDCRAETGIIVSVSAHPTFTKEKTSDVTIIVYL